MGKIYNSRQNYNQLKRKQYVEYLKMQNKYYSCKKKYYEEYLKRLDMYYLYKQRYYIECLKRLDKYYLDEKKYYEECFRRQNGYYFYKKKYDKEHHKKNNDILANKRKYDNTDISQSEFLNSLKTGIIEDNINYDSIKNNNYGYLEINIEENNLEYKKHDLVQYNNLENKNCTSTEDSYNEELLEVDYNTVAKEDISNETNASFRGVYVKLPVILAEANITIPVEATITLNQAVMEIKRIKKNVFLTKSRLIPFSPSALDPNSGILFIAGFIRKNIEYATQTCTTVGTTNICGEIKHYTVEVPFNFTTRITFLRAPIFIKNTTTSALEFFTDEQQFCDISVDPADGCNTCDQTFVFTEVFNEKPFVELIQATITEVDIHKNPILGHETSAEQIFSEITEKIIVNLTLKVLQKQPVRVTAIE